MAELNCQFVRPDRMLYHGPVQSLVLVSISGEVGVWPGHAPEICALGEGVVRLHLREQDGGGVVRVLISGGYAEIQGDQVIILADHARRTDDIDVDTVRQTRDNAIDAMEALDPEDSRHAYYKSKISWCNLLLKHVNDH